MNQPDRSRNVLRKRTFPGYLYPDLLRAIDVSVEGLEPTDRERYLDMAVFPEDVPIPEGPSRILWNTDEIDTRDCILAWWRIRLQRGRQMEKVSSCMTFNAI
jgi:hypothetical protein